MFYKVSDTDTGRTLADLAPGQSGEVEDCHGEGPMFQRLCEMGVVEGARVRVVRRAPFGDPIHIRLNDYDLALRRAEAMLIRLK